MTQVYPFYKPIGSLTRRVTLPYTVPPPPCAVRGRIGCGVVAILVMLRNRGFSASDCVVRFGLHGEVPVGRRE